MSAELVLYEDLEVSAGVATVMTEEQEPRGWVTLVRMEQCPGRCAGGETLAGDDLVECGICRGSGWVPVGIGGALVHYSAPVPIPEEPTEFFYETTLRDVILSAQPSEPALCEESESPAHPVGLQEEKK